MTYLEKSHINFAAYSEWDFAFLNNGWGRSGKTWKQALFLQFCLELK